MIDPTTLPACHRPIAVVRTGWQSDTPPVCLHPGEPNVACWGVEEGA